MIALEQNDLGGLVGSLLSDPKTMESIRQMAESLKIGGAPALAGEDGTEETADVKAEAKPGSEKGLSAAPSRSPGKGGKSKTNELTALLTAVKPFLSKEKCKTVDEAIGILRLIGLSGQTDLLKGLSTLLR